MFGPVAGKPTRILIIHAHSPTAVLLATRDRSLENRINLARSFELGRKGQTDKSRPLPMNNDCQSSPQILCEQQLL